MSTQQIEKASEAVRRRPEYRGALALHCMGVLRGLDWPDEKASGGPCTLGITSSCPGEGVSTLVAHLAATAAVCGAGPVLAVDCNLARPSLHRLFGVPRDPGLAEGLRQDMPEGEVIRQSALANLFVVGAGEPHGSPARAYQSLALPQLVKTMASRFALTVFDMPPVGQQSCVRRLAGLLDGVLLVVEAERIGWKAARRATELLAGADARLLGVLLNKRRRRLSE